MSHTDSHARAPDLFMPAATLSPAGPGWAGNSVNAPVFRKNPICSFGDHQYLSYYNEAGRVVIAHRLLPEGAWEPRETALSGDIRDAHRNISMAIDGDGYIHLAWDHHNNPLNYAVSREPFSTEFESPRAMTGRGEDDVTYPEFYRLPGGDLLFLFRQGLSGRGNLVINRYNRARRTWSRVQDVLLDGEDARSAYWQACVGGDGTLHLSWVWRETFDVASNHDLCYARSRDGGVSWERSDGTACTLPITAANAEYALRIPQGSGLINQTAMCADSRGRPFIASYWRDRESGIPQYRLVWRASDGWRASYRWRHVAASKRTSGFRLEGGGTKRIPISRPQLVAHEGRGGLSVYIFFRDEERGSRVSLLSCPDIDAAELTWALFDLTDFPVDSWEPSFDGDLWTERGLLDLFVQRVGQGDSEGLEELPPQMVYSMRVDLPSISPGPR